MRLSPVPAAAATLGALVLVVSGALPASSVVGTPAEVGRAPAPTEAPSPTGTPTPAPTAPVTTVVAISIDGLNPTALSRLGTAGTPNLHRLLASGASTLNARSAFELTITLPNHTGMVTSRRVNAAKGGHGVTWNDDRLTPNTVQAAAGEEVESVFTQVHDAGLATSLFAAKTKFSLWQRSWPDAIDQVTINENNAALVKSFRADLATPRAFRFLHLSLPDRAGHASGFMGQRYLGAVRRTDKLLGRVLAGVDASAEAGTTAVVLTSDHGGIGPNHADRSLLANNRILFAVRAPGVGAGTDLYALNSDYRNPGKRRPGYGAARQPVRNAALGNLSLDLLGLAPIPDSGINTAQDLDVVPVP